MKHYIDLKNEYFRLEKMANGFAYVIVGIDLFFIFYILAIHADVFREYQFIHAGMLDRIIQDTSTAKFFGNTSFILSICLFLLMFLALLNKKERIKKNHNIFFFIGCLMSLITIYFSLSNATLLINKIEMIKYSGMTHELMNQFTKSGEIHFIFWIIFVFISMIFLILGCVYFKKDKKDNKKDYYYIYKT